MASERQILEQLKKVRGFSTVILGIGNTLKADDGVGSFICEQLRQRAIVADLIDAGTVPENYIERIIKKEPSSLLIIDATDFGGKGGQIEIFGIEQLNKVAISTHTLSPRLFIEMIKQAIEVDVYFVGIQPKQTELGEAMSEEVKQSAEKLIRILTEIFGSKDNNLPDGS